jgi:thiamine-phosphate pyrophosphorylase
VPFILNDRPDLAALLGADGVHVGQDDPSPFVARRVVGEQAVIGLSTHALHEVEAAVGVPSAGPGPDHPTTGAQSTTTPAPVQYLSAGPVTSTPTKPGRPGTGLGYITEAVARSPWPVWITGGVDPTSVGAMAGAGARHFVVVRFLCEAEDPRRHALQLRRAIEEALARSAV